MTLLFIESEDFNTSYRIYVPALERFEVILGEKMEEVKEFMYLGIMLCKHGVMEEEIRERVVKGR